MNLTKGDTVIDSRGQTGTITSDPKEDPHNVEVDWDGGGLGTYCIVPECINFYDPLNAVARDSFKIPGFDKDVIRKWVYLQYRTMREANHTIPDEVLAWFKDTLMTAIDPPEVK